MKTIIVDQFEAGLEASEETVTINIAAKSEDGFPYPDIHAFARSIRGDAPEKIELSPTKVGGFMAERYLPRFAGIDFNPAWPAFLIEDTYDIHHVVFDAEGNWISYRWETSA